MEILIISGLSGSGKSRTAAFLEDIGYYIVDNLPAEMMLKFANFCTASGGRYDRVALVYDVRAGEPFQRLIDVQDKLRRRDNVRTPGSLSAAIRRRGGPIRCVPRAAPSRRL